MLVNKKIFHGYDIRGVVNKDLTPKVSYAIGCALVTLLQKEQPQQRLQIVVGRDMRSHSLSLQENLIQGLLASGADVIDIGLVSTPAYFFAVSFLKADGGVMVSASHNPPEYNGFKITRSMGAMMSGQTGLLAIAQIIEEEDFLWTDKPGILLRKDGIPEKAMEAELALLSKDPIGHFSVVADSGNGMGAQYLDLFFEKNPFVVHRLYWELDGTFPHHPPDPSRGENTRDLCQMVLEQKADVGIATDGDGDRLFLVDEQGQIVRSEVLLALLSQIILRRFPHSSICYDIRPGRIREEMIKVAGGVPIEARAGNPFIKASMQEHGAILGGELSGHYFLKSPYGIFETPVAVLGLVLQEMTGTQKSLSELVLGLRKYVHPDEMNFSVQDKDVLLKKLKTHYADAHMQEIDGISVTYPDVWFNIRASNTEPFVRLNIEGISEEAIQKYLPQLLSLIQA